jgi:dihydroxy-acid dehydratase
VNVSEGGARAAQGQWKQPKPRYTTGVLAKYAALVRDASHGAVTD